MASGEFAGKNPALIAVVAAALACQALLAGSVCSAGPAEPAWVAVRYLADGERIALRWSPVPGATSYRLWRRHGAEQPFEVRADVDGVQYFDAPAVPGRTYRYRLQSLSAGGEGPFSEERTVAVPVPLPPRESDAPVWQGIQVQAHERRDGPPRLRVHLEWRAVRGALGYQLLRRETGGGEFATLAFLTRNAALDTAVEEGRTYEYAVTTLGENFDESTPSLARIVPVGAATADVRVPPPPLLSPLSATRVWEVLNALPGAATAGRAPLDDPFDLAYDAARDRLYVSSTVNRQILVLRGTDGKPLATFGPAFGSTQLRRPLGIGLDGRGNIHVVDEAPGAILVLSPEGALRRRIALPGKSRPRPLRPLDVAVHRNGRLFVTDGASRQVLVLSPEGRLISRWSPSPKEAPLLAVGAIEIAPDGNIVVADPAAARIRVFTPAGRAVGGFGDRGTGEGQMLFLGGVTVLRDGSFLASDISNARLSVFGPSAGLLTLDPGVSPERPAPPLLGPLNLASDGRDRVFIAEGIANRVTCLKLTLRPQPAGDDSQ